MPSEQELADLFPEVAAMGVFNQGATVTDPPDDDDPGEPVEEPEVESDEEEEEEAPDVVAAQTFELDGEEIPADLIRAYHQFSQQLQSDPNLQQVIANYLQSGGQPQASQPQPSPAAGEWGVAPPGDAPAPAPTGFVIPEGIDTTDPGTQWLVNQLREQHEYRQRLDQQLGLLTQSVQQSTMQQQHEQRRQNETHVNQAVSQFKEDKGLNDGELAHIRQVAANLNVLEPLTKGVDPFTGAPTEVDLTAAIYKAMDIALNSMPEYQERVAQRLAKQQQQDTTRKGKLTALSSPSGSGSRTPRPPANEAERRNAMIASVAAAMNGGAE